MTQRILGRGRKLPAVAAAFGGLIAALTLIASPALAADPTFPALSGRVVDAAHILTPDAVQHITERSAAVEAQSGRQLVVATVPSLQGLEIEDYGYKLGRAWGIGEKGKNNGLILLVAPTEKKVRIEVGYGLEGDITDALSSVVMDQKILPRFRAGDLPGGVSAGADALADLMALPADQLQAKSAAAASERATTRTERPSARHGIPIIFVLFLLFWVFTAVFGRRGGRGGELASVGYPGRHVRPRRS
ncbi:hypothetical protein BH09PSE2_BH09PSE2_25860 [soil metagenome]